MLASLLRKSSLHAAHRYLLKQSPSLYGLPSVAVYPAPYHDHPHTILFSSPASLLQNQDQERATETPGQVHPKLMEWKANARKYIPHTTKHIMFHGSLEGVVEVVGSLLAEVRAEQLTFIQADCCEVLDCIEAVPVRTLDVWTTGPPKFFLGPWTGVAACEKQNANEYRMVDELCRHPHLQQLIVCRHQIIEDTEAVIQKLAPHLTITYREATGMDGVNLEVVAICLCGVLLVFLMYRPADVRMREKSL
eukprot:NODE_3858_length_883_cov_52.976190_g3705_i0.p1 GENE.NODE_3858_length_883_cov_52.976190_g3705_i0~~NODE_3858_length_883_cov_52.976190_g3705_i0.p1  ORF type:complete len:249 (-),score=46.29 NODE_3858_length_883_cov_52.976190_g3705_i0:49-795(-)